MKAAGKYRQLIKELNSCPAGKEGCRQFEKIVAQILKELFMPPLSNHRNQVRTFLGTGRIDLVFSNRVESLDDKSTRADKNWHFLRKEVNARQIIFEIKNYKKREIGPEQVYQVARYMNEETGQLAILVCNKKPSNEAHIRRLYIFMKMNKKIVLFVTKKDLQKMLKSKILGKEPSDLIVDLVEDFLIKH